MNRGVSRLTDEAFWIVLGQVAVVLGSLASVRVLTGLLDPSLYGQLALAITMAALANQTLMGGVANAIGRYYSIAEEDNDLKGYVADALRLLTAACGVVVAVGLVLCIILLFTRSTAWIAPILILIPLAILNGFNVCLNSLQNAARQRAVVSWHGGMEAWLKIAFAVVGITVLGPTLSAVLLGFTCSSALVLISQLAFLRRSLNVSLLDDLLRPTPRSGWTKELFRFAWPFSSWGLFTWAQQSSDRWALAVFASVASVGQYNVAYQLGYTPILMATNMCTTLLGPVFFSKAGSGEDELRKVSARQSIWGTTCAAAALTLLAFVLAFAVREPLFRILVSEPFLASSAYFPWLVLGGGLFATGQMLTMQHLAELKPSALVGLKILTAILGCIAAFAGAFSMGTWGVVGAVMFFGVIYLGAVLYSVLRHL
jgi:O-antigen/teichoic acid export membrane protein